MIIRTQQIGIVGQVIFPRRGELMNSYVCGVGSYKLIKYQIKNLGWIISLAVLAAVAMLVLPAPSYAQLNYGRIFGAVTDQSGGAIAGATVTILDVTRGVSRPLTTDASGEYSAPSLIPGSYTVRAEF